MFATALRIPIINTIFSMCMNTASGYANVFEYCFQIQRNSATTLNDNAAP